MNQRLTLTCCLLLCGRLPAQTPPAPEFEVANIKLNVSGGAIDFDVLPSGLFRSTNLPLDFLFKFAFEVTDSTLDGEPAWFRTDRYDVIAKAPSKTSAAAVRLMLQSFLIRELKLTVHTEQRNLGAYVLTVRKDGPKLQNSSGTGDPSCRPSEMPKPGERGSVHVLCKNMGMPELAKTLQRMAPGYLDKPVIDQTGLAGSYDFPLQWVASGRIDDEGGLTVFGAVEKVGLKLEAKKIPLPVIVIDHAEKPAQN